MSAEKITQKNFTEKVMNNEKPVLLDFWAKWCGSCKMVAPEVESIAEEHPEYFVGKVNVDEEPVLAKMFQIQSIPAIFVIKKGKINKYVIGAQPKEKLLELFD